MKIDKMEILKVYYELDDNGEEYIRVVSSVTGLPASFVDAMADAFQEASDSWADTNGYPLSGVLNV